MKSPLFVSLLLARSVYFNASVKRGFLSQRGEQEPGNRNRSYVCGMTIAYLFPRQCLNGSFDG